MKKATLALLAGAVISLSGCATSSLIEKDGHTYTKKVKQTLVSDQVLAFGKPALALPNIPQDAVVIVGMKQSYVLTEGGRRFETLLTRLDPRYITLQNSLDFYSAKMTADLRANCPLNTLVLKTKLPITTSISFYKMASKNVAAAVIKSLALKVFALTFPCQAWFTLPSATKIA